MNQDGNGLQMKLIFIHQSGSMKEEWYYQTKYFDGSEAIDLPGHPDGQLCTSADDYMEWMRQYIRQRKYQEVVLVGHSLGGAIALLYGLKYPEGLKALVMIGTGARLRVHPMYLAEYEAGLKDKTNWEKNLDFHSEFFNPEQREALRKKQLAIGPAAKLNDYLCCDKFDIMDRVREIKLPTLVLCGSEDIMTPVKYSRYLAHKIAGAREVIIQGATHDVCLEKPDEVNRAISEFLRSLPG